MTTKDTFSRVLHQLRGNVGNTQSGAGINTPDMGRVVTNSNYSRQATEFEIETLIAGNELVDRMIVTIPRQATKTPPEITGTSKARIKKIQNYLANQKWHEVFREAGILANRYGVCYVYLSVNDGDDRLPLTGSEISSYLYLTADNCRPCLDDMTYRHAKPVMWQITIDGNITEVHHTRLITFYGKKRYGHELKNSGYQHEPIWVGSFNALLNYLESQSAALGMLKDASVGIFKFSGLNELLAQAASCVEDDAMITKQIYHRLSSLVDSATITKKMIVDKDKEDYEFVERSYTGVKEIIQDFRQAFLGMSPLPASILFSNSEQSGLFSSGNAGDRELLNHMVAEYQGEQLHPAFSRVIEIAFGSNDCQLSFKPSIDLSSVEKSKNLFEISKSLTALVAQGILTPEVAAKRLTSLDLLGIEESEIEEIRKANEEATKNGLKKREDNTNGITANQLNN